jgi:hypothetical protein
MDEVRAVGPVIVRPGTSNASSVPEISWPALHQFVVQEIDESLRGGTAPKQSRGHAPEPIAVEVKPGDLEGDAVRDHASADGDRTVAAEDPADPAGDLCNADEPYCDAG